MLCEPLLIASLFLLLAAAFLPDAVSLRLLVSAPHGDRLSQHTHRHRLALLALLLPRHPPERSNLLALLRAQVRHRRPHLVEHALRLDVVVEREAESTHF